MKQTEKTVSPATSHNSTTTKKNTKNLYDKTNKSLMPKGVHIPTEMGHHPNIQS
jgi:hypothetical protein